MEDDLHKSLENISKENYLVLESKIFKIQKDNIKTKFQRFFRAPFNKEEKNNLTINNNNLKRNSRNPGIDLIRLITMYGIIINHILYHHGGIKKFSKYSKYLKILHKLYNNELNLGDGYFPKSIINFLKQMLNEKYDGILNILLSISVSLFFLQLPYNKYVAKIICFLGPLVFGIYLIHENTIIKTNILKYIFYNDSNNINNNYNPGLDLHYPQRFF